MPNIESQLATVQKILPHCATAARGGGRQGRVGRGVGRQGGLVTLTQQAKEGQVHSSSIMAIVILVVLLFSLSFFFPFTYSHIHAGTHTQTHTLILALSFAATTLSRLSVSAPQAKGPAPSDLHFSIDRIDVILYSLYTSHTPTYIQNSSKAGSV